MTRTNTIFTGGRLGQLAGAKVTITEPGPLDMIQAAGLVNATPSEFSKAVKESTYPPAAVLQQTLALFSGPDKVKGCCPTRRPRAHDPAGRAGREDRRAPELLVTETLPATTIDYVAWMDQRVGALSAAQGNAS